MVFGSAPMGFYPPRAPHLATDIGEVTCEIPGRRIETPDSESHYAN